MNGNISKYQEALDRIKNTDNIDVKKINKEVLKIVRKGHIKDCDLLQELVYKATPKKPLNIYYGLSEQQGICPNCNKKLFEPLMELAYSKDDDLEYFTKVKLSNCNHCGQAIDWNNDEPTK